MIAALKAELRKLCTIRSTYIFVGLAFAFVIFYAFYIVGWRGTPGDLHNRHLLESVVEGALTSLPMIFGAVVAILLMTHEYRYNTIMYTLTSSNSRSKVLWSRFLIVSAFGLIFTAFIAVLAPLMSYAGIAVHGHKLVPQILPYSSLVWRSLFYGWGYITLALVLAALIRNQIGAIVSLFIVPTFEQVLSLLLKHASVYLPFIALSGVVQAPEDRLGTISFGRAALVFGIYLVVGWIVAWFLFARRDAN